MLWGINKGEIGMKDHILGLLLCVMSISSIMAMEKPSPVLLKPKTQPAQAQRPSMIQRLTPSEAKLKELIPNEAELSRLRGTRISHWASMMNGDFYRRKI